MIKRTIIVETPSRLSMKNGQLICSNIDDREDVKSAPIEDLGVVVIENQRASLTVPLINALTDNNVCVIYCDAHGLPSSVVLSLSANAIQSEVTRAQMQAGAVLNKRLWKQIVEAKIHNQARLLEKLGKEGDSLKPYYSNVKSGDSDNREGAAARVYWRTLFGSGFTRDRGGDSPNNLLNYGYSILRSAVARALVGSGLNLTYGLFHHNRYNPMPLADDVMEPFRPFVDEIVYELVSNGEYELTMEVKSFLVGVLSCDTVYSDCLRPLQIGLSMTTASLARCYLGQDKEMSLPMLE